MLRYGLIPTILWSIGTNKGYLEVCKWIIPPSFQQVLVYSVKGGPLPFSESALFDSPSWNFLNDASLLRPIWYYVHRPGSSFSDQLEILEFIFPLGPAAVAVIPVGWSFFPLPIIINWTVVTWSSRKCVYLKLDFEFSLKGNKLAVIYLIKCGSMHHLGLTILILFNRSVALKPSYDINAIKLIYC